MTHVPPDPPPPRSSLLTFNRGFSAPGLWFYLAEGDTRCFVEEVPESTLVVGTFKVLDNAADSMDAPSAKVIVQDPNQVELTSRTIDREGRFAFTSEQVRPRTGASWLLPGLPPRVPL